MKSLSISSVESKLEIVASISKKTFNFSFDTYLKKVNKIISAYNKDEIELNYRYKLLISNDEKMMEGNLLP
jgi:hypothetical protein